MAYIRGCKNPDCIEHNPSNPRIDLELQYTDKQHDIELYTKLTSPLTLTIHDITKDLVEFLYLDDIPPEEIHLVGLNQYGHHLQLEIADLEMKLHELGVINGCTLYFEPAPNAAPPKVCHLTIIGPDEVEKVDYEWYRAKTTLGMLLEYIIKRFSLEFVEPERIHLLTIINELDFAAFSDARLSQLDLHNGMSIHVQIIPPLSSTAINENINVHVECTYDHDKFMLHLPNTETIGELKNKIQKQFEGGDVLDFKLFNENEEEFRTNNPDRTLKSFGVIPGQTIFITFRLITRNIQPSIVNNHIEASTISSVDTKKNSEKVTVICHYPSNDDETIQVPLKDTVGQLIKKIETVSHCQLLAISEMGSSTINIDYENEVFRCLDDLGFKSDDIIHVTIIDKAPSNSATGSSRSLLSSKADKRSKVRRINKKPVGLDNLGHSDYMNSVLQCLAHIPQLSNYFLEGLSRAYMNDDEHAENGWNPCDQAGEVTGAYADLLWKLWRCDENGDNYDSITPDHIKQKIGVKDSRFATKDQQDAHEFMTFFLDAIHEELKSKTRNDRTTIIEELFLGEITSSKTCNACEAKGSATHPTSSLTIPINRQERTFWITFIPKNGKDEISYVDVPMDGRVEHIVDLFSQSFRRPSLFQYILAMVPDGELDFQTPLSEIPTDELIFMEQEECTNNSKPKPLENSTKRSTLEDCLRAFFSSEEPEDELTYQRERCERNTTSAKQHSLQTLPPVLIIHLKRFLHENDLHQKVETFVDYPITELNLNRFLSSEEEAIYDLVAVCTHMGSIGNGYYAAYARHTKYNKTAWYKFDDSTVTLVKEQDYGYHIVTKHAYLLFYIKRDMEEYSTETTLV